MSGAERHPEKNYDPARVEPRWYAWWLERGYFHSEPRRGGRPYCIVIPPPNVTGILHMGHALNNTIQDVLIRWRRMQGYNAVWVPGTDHAGIATQNVVERELQKGGKSRHDLGREEFLQRVWAWKERYGSTIIGQLKRLGASCDWQRERFTMDEGLSNAVSEVFVRLYEKGLIYRGNYIINWCPRCQTALSDEESEHREVEGKLYYIRYPVHGGRKKEFVTVATTRPETMLGDVAVAVNPRDGRYKQLIGSALRLPILQRQLRVIGDDFVDPEFGTGAVKVTPAHDPNDFEIARRHDLAPVNVMNPDGTINDNGGPYAGLDRFECRRKILEDLQEQGLLEKVENHRHAVGHCYRCDTIVEPRLSRQWFVRMKQLARPAIDAVREGRIRFVPERWTKVYMDWMENIRDWCISRQIWWGHRIPIFYCRKCDNQWASRSLPARCPRCGAADIGQDEDVLDTWFSSWLWPFSVFGWPEDTPELRFYYPTSTLVTASEIIFFWVARMIMAGMEFMGEVPFRTVYIHGTVRDEIGRKMSKSLGNSVDPLDIIRKYSADALRFSLIRLAATGQDVYISDEKFEVGRNFATKIWNAARYVKMQTGEPPADIVKPELDPAILSPDDRHILSTLHRTIAECTDALERYRFNDSARLIHEFFWHQFCDWYVEYSKQVFREADAARRIQTGKILHYVLANALRLLHPIMPFISEELWQQMGYRTLAESIVVAPWPEALSPEELARRWEVTPEVANYVEAKHDLIRMARLLKADFGIPPSKKVSYIVRPADKESAGRLEHDAASIAALLRAESLRIDSGFSPRKALPSRLSRLGMVYMPIEELIDVDAEIERLSTQLEKISEDLRRLTRKLENEEFIRQAPPHVVARQEERRNELLEKHDKIKAIMTMLSEHAAASPRSPSEPRNTTEE